MRFVLTILQEEGFDWMKNLAILLMENWLNFNSTNYKILNNISMMALIAETQKSKFANI